MNTQVFEYQDAKIRYLIDFENKALFFNHADLTKALDIQAKSTIVEPGYIPLAGALHIHNLSLVSERSDLLAELVEHAYSTLPPPFREDSVSECLTQSTSFIFKTALMFLNAWFKKLIGFKM